jgi:hypothetical protein
MDPIASEAKLWSLSSTELASACQQIAAGNAPSAGATLEAEAGRLYASWRDAMEQPGDELEDRERKASQRAALRKRTIEILIKINRSQ